MHKIIIKKYPSLILYTKCCAHFLKIKKLLLYKVIHKSIVHTLQTVDFTQIFVYNSTDFSCTNYFFKTIVFIIVHSIYHEHFIKIITTKIIHNIIVHSIYRAHFMKIITAEIIHNIIMHSIYGEHFIKIITTEIIHNIIVHSIYRAHFIKIITAEIIHNIIVYKEWLPQRDF